MYIHMLGCLLRINIFAINFVQMEWFILFRVSILLVI